MPNAFIELLAKLSRKLLPSQCLQCYSTTIHGSGLCHLCYNELPILQQKCALCAQYLPSNITNTLCHACSNNNLPFDQVFVLSPYLPPISTWISRLKFQQQLIYARLFGYLLTEKIIIEWYHNRSLPNLIIPVPLHPQRLRERGFNQALEIARPITKTCHIPIDAISTTRIKSTMAQSGLSGTERKRNIQSAFASSNAYHGQHIAVLDDVVTTGQTIGEFCQLLKSKGAHTIDVWCCARVF